MKPTGTIKDHIGRLESRGMSVDQNLAEQWLSNVSYYRLSGYWYSFRAVDSAKISTRLDRFVPGTTFTDVATLYEFDRKLRSLIFDGIERIEIALRTALIEITCHPDPLAYEKPQTFRTQFDHSDWLDTVHRRIARARRQNRAIKHYSTKYNGVFPFWVAAEVLDSSDASRMFEGLTTSSQFAVSDRLGFDFNLHELSRNQQKKVKASHPLVRWFEQLSVIRNTCAHHARLWNHAFVPAPTNALRTIQGLEHLPAGQSERLFGAVELMKFMLEEISPGTSWPRKFADLLDTSFDPIPGRDRAELGKPL